MRLRWLLPCTHTPATVLFHQDADSGAFTRNQFLKNMALMIALAWFPYSAQAHFLTKNPTTCEIRTKLGSHSDPKWATIPEQNGRQRNSDFAYRLDMQ
jgi:hypothetical protein